jgi:putative aldouronate transport system substrate-binding protein
LRLIAAGPFAEPGRSIRLAAPVPPSRKRVHAEGWAPWNDFWRQGRQQTPRVNFGHIYVFPAHDGGKPTYYLYQGYVAATALSKAAPGRLAELLRIMNWLAARFGSAEDALLSYGIKDVHYTADEKGNPQPGQTGLSEGRYVPWQYVVQRPQVIYIADIPGYVEAAVQVEQTLIPLGVADPTLGFYSLMHGNRGALRRLAMLEGVRDTIAGRRPMSDYDTLVKDWASSGGEQIRKEFSNAIAARGAYEAG